MKTVVVQFPGTNRERDMIAALAAAFGLPPTLVWHGETALPKADLVVLPGGFSYGDYLRAGAIGARSPIMAAIVAHARAGGLVFGVCNGFQILCETTLLPGVLMRNASLKFVCRDVLISVENNRTAFTRNYSDGQIFRCPVSHHDGNYFADADTLARLEGEKRVVFRYTLDTNPNGSQHDVAGIINETGTVLGMMPHPENMVEDAHGGADGATLFASLAEHLATKAS